MNVVVLRVPYWGLGNLGPLLGFEKFGEEKYSTILTPHGGRWSLLVSSTKRNKPKDETKQNKTQ